MKVFISGGCKNGKSTTAENIAVKLAGGRPLYYMATMIPRDEEDRIRIARHVEARKGKGFLTVECGESLCGGLEKIRAGCLPQEGCTDGSGSGCTENGCAAGPGNGCIEAAVDRTGAGREPAGQNGVFLVDAVTSLLANRYDDPAAVLKDLKEFCSRVDTAVFVSDFICSASEGYSEYTELYRKGLADCDRFLASVSDAVIEICAGQAIIYKGKELL